MSREEESACRAPIIRQRAAKRRSIWLDTKNCFCPAPSCFAIESTNVAQLLLDEVMRRINGVGPEMLTIGVLRATNPSVLRKAAEKNGRNGSIFNYISTVDPSGFKHRTEHDFHVSIFCKIKEHLAPGISLGLCKEDDSLWGRLTSGGAAATACMGATIR